MRSGCLVVRLGQAVPCTSKDVLQQRCFFVGPLNLLQDLRCNTCRVALRIEVLFFLHPTKLPEYIISLAMVLTTIFRQGSVMDGTIPPLHGPCYIKPPKKSVVKYSSPIAATRSTMLCSSSGFSADDCERRARGLLKAVKITKPRLKVVNKPHLRTRDRETPNRAGLAVQDLILTGQYLP